MADLGYIAIALAMASALYAAAACLWGQRRGEPQLVASGRNAVFAAGGLLTLAVLLLVYSFLVHDFQIRYVAENSSRHMPTLYLITSLWGGHAGSLLFWAWILSMFTTAVTYLYRDRHPALMPYTSAVLSIAQSFFLILLVFLANPFEKLPFIPGDGLGLNPLLQNLGMAIHPPNLYLGYVGFSVPWAFAMAALLSGKLDAGWIRATRRWTLLAWLFLSLGVTLGGQWAYVELGWGGYWGWDPVENSSFLPWLTGTAFLHSVIVTERRGMLKVWNMLLIILTYNLAIFGAFVTRSGIIDSVHSFTESAIGPAFLAYIALSLIGSLLLLFRRWDQLGGDHHLEAILSKEAAFLLNNLLFLGATFAIFWGNIFPILSEAVRGVKVTVGAPFFNQVSAPIFWAILITMALGMLIAWRRQTMSSLMLSLRAPVSAGIVAAIALWLLGVRLLPALLGLSTCVLVGTVTLREFYQGMLARHRLTGEPYSVALRKLIARNRPRYGGYMVHLGVILAAAGIIGSQAYQQEAQAVLGPGQAMHIGGYRLVFQGFSELRNQNLQLIRANLDVYNSQGRYLGRAEPAKELHFVRPDQPMTEADIFRAIGEPRTLVLEDVYLILVAASPEGTATIRAFINPLVNWIWIGATILIAGTMVAVWPEAREMRVRVPGGVPQPAGSPTGW